MKAIQGPRGRVYPDHSPQSVCIIGMGPSCQNYMTETMTQELTPDHHDEVWGINMVGNCFRTDLIFWMDDLVNQAALTPHPKFPTTMLKAAFEDERIWPLRERGGPKFAAFVASVRALPEWVSHEVYDYHFEEFKSIMNAQFRDFPISGINEVMVMLGEDRKLGKMDESRSLSGLIKYLDRHKTPVMSSIRRPEMVENSFDYPIDEIAAIGIQRFGKPYLNNGVAQAIGYALWKDVKRVKIYGADFTYPNRTFAEGGRACVESWITLASGPPYDMSIMLSEHTSLMDNVGDSGVYGYATQPEIHLPDGQVFTYKKTQEMQGNYVRPAGDYIPPDTTNAHLKVMNELSGSAQADSASGPRGRIPEPREPDVPAVRV